MSVFSALADIFVCRECKRRVSFEQSGETELEFKISVHCRCEKTLLFPSDPFVHNLFEINRHIVFAMRLHSVAREGINISCGVMNLGSGPSKKAYDNIVEPCTRLSEKYLI